MDLKRIAGPLVTLTMLAGLVAPALVVAGAAGTKFGFLDWATGYGLLTLKWGGLAAMVGTGLGVLALLLALTDFRRLGVPALIAFLAPGAVLAGGVVLRVSAASRPPIHDVATDWTDPLTFSRQMAADRGDAPIRVEDDPRVPTEAGPPWGGLRVADVNARTCPGAKPVRRQLDPDDVETALERHGVQVTGKSPWRVEGTAESFWFGFKDDVVVRIRPGRTDVRSVSRVSRFGGSDVGVNCKRVTAIVAALGEP